MKSRNENEGADCRGEGSLRCDPGSEFSTIGRREREHKGECDKREEETKTT